MQAILLTLLIIGIVTMMSSIISSKGQVTIPTELRKSFGIQAGDRLIFSRSGSKIIIVKRKSKVEQSFGILKAHVAVSINEMNKAHR